MLKSRVMPVVRANTMDMQQEFSQT